MATVSPAYSSVQAQGENVPRIIWEALATGDTVVAAAIPYQAAIAGSVQIVGTFGGATVKLQVSNDGSTFFDMVDLGANALEATANAFFEFTTAAVYLRPAISGGTGDDVDVIVCLRGN
jgi:hypothetical protein